MTKVGNSTKEVPEVLAEEDIPFSRSPDSEANITSGDKLDKADDLDKEITRFRFRTGKKVLYIAMGAMGIAVVLDLFAAYVLHIESEMVKNAFEAFKLITMTVLGYIFGSNTKQ